LANVNLIANRPLSEIPDLPVNESKGGEGHDSCPCCTKESDAMFNNRQGEGQQEQYDWSLYSCDATAGGCGYSWDRTTAQGAAKNASRGMNTKRLTGSANKVSMMPGLSRAYARNLDAIDWSKGAPNLCFPEMNEKRGVTNANNR
jgi:hypothetical protein